ncbi:MAG TPA: ribonuclease P protein component [Flavobacterium sp.]|nr:ribonuclease P protein component [Flavobacterium sp.]
MDARYPKEAKLKSHDAIGRLFTEGKSVAKYPLRLVYVPLDGADGHQVGVSVSKKYFRKAVDRNYYKRILRETYRTRKELLAPLHTSYAVMLFYQTADRLPFAQVDALMDALLHKFVAATSRENPDNTH